MTTIRIPKAASKAVDALTDLGALVTATEWQRAAIVAALVGPAPGSGGQNSGERTAEVRFAHTVESLAALGLPGLRSTNTVARYRDAWCGERKAPALGTSVNLDGLPDWPPTRTGTDGYSTEQGAAATIKKIVEKHGTSVIAEAATAAIKADPKTAEAAAVALASTEAGSKAAARHLASTAEGRITARDAIEEASTPAGPRPTRGITQSAMLVAIHKWSAAGDAVVQAIRDHGERLTEAEADALVGAANRARAAADFVEAGATGQTIDEELTALLNRKD